MYINLKLDGAPDKKLLTRQILGLQSHEFLNLSAIELQEYFKNTLAKTWNYNQVFYET